MTSEGGNGPLHALADYASRRDALLARIVGMLEADQRVRAAWLSGSFGRGEADAWSDLDLHIVVDDHLLAGFWSERDGLYIRVGQPVLVQPEMESNSQAGGHFQLVVYDGPLEVDWNIGPLSQARRPSTSQMIVEHVAVTVHTPPPIAPTNRLTWLDHQLTFFWAMAPIAVKYIGRAQTRRAVRQIDLLSGALVTLWRLVGDASEPDPGAAAANRVLEPDLARRLPTLSERIDPLVCLEVLRAQCAEVEKLHPALRALDVSIPRDMPDQVHRLAALAEAVLLERLRPG